MTLKWGLSLAGNFYFCVPKRPLSKTPNIWMKSWITARPKAQQEAHTTLDGTAKRGTRTVRPGWGLGEAASPPHRGRSEKGKCEGTVPWEWRCGRDQSEKEREEVSPPLCGHLIGKYARDGETLRQHQNNRFVNLPGRRAASWIQAPEEKESFHFPKRVGTKSLAYICFPTKSSCHWRPKSYLRR